MSRPEMLPRHRAILDDYYDTMRQGVHMAQEESVAWERKSASKTAINYDLERKTLTNTFQAKMPPDGPIWDLYSVSTIDPWTFMVASSHRNETVTILVMGKDGFGVSKIQFTKLNRQIQCRGVNIRLVICHDGQSQRKSNASLLGWTTSSNRNDTYYQEFDYSTLVSHMRGLPNG